jgi:hypothetical protein
MPHRVSELGLSFEPPSIRIVVVTKFSVGGKLCGYTAVEDGNLPWNWLRRKGGAK